MAGSLTESTFVWDRNDGAVSIYESGLGLDGAIVLPGRRLPEGVVFAATNVDLVDGSIVKPRKGTTAFSTTGSPPTTQTRYLFVQRSSNFTTSVSASTVSETLWAFASNGSAAMTAHSYNGSTWTSHTLTDTAASLAQPHCVQYNGKLFAAYNSASNRLHCYDGTQWRRVGLVAGAAATVADTGAGAYPATLRYYKIQWELWSGSTIQASSELGPSVSFTPSGAGAAARITKPATVDSATHWVVWASSDDVSYYQLARAVVGTTTYDDTTVTSAYGSSTAPIVAPEAGLYVPPPSARFLATDGTRLLMAGSFETSAGSGETTPSSKRVWFTRPLGATDTGDDESITQTSTSRYYLDIDDPADATITGLAVMNGIVYVLFPQSVWRLIPTGLSDIPYRSEQVSATAGAMSQYAVAVGAMADSGDEAIYMVAERTGLSRVSATGGVEWLGRGVVPRTLPPLTSDVRLVFSPITRDLWVTVLYSFSRFVGCVDLTRFRRHGHEFVGGMRAMTFASVQFDTMVPYSTGMVFADSVGPALYMSSGSTDSGVAFSASVSGPAIHDYTRTVAATAPIVQFGYSNPGGVSCTIGYADRYHADGAFAATVTTSTTTGAFGARVRAHGLEMANARELQPFVTLPSNSNATTVEALVVPYQTQEPL